MDFKKILLINFGGIGDEVLFLPVIKALKEKYKNTEIILTLEPRSRSIIDLCPLIDGVIPVDIKCKNKYFNILKFLFKARKEKFDLVISSGKSPLVAVLCKLTGAEKSIGFASKTDFLLTHKVKLNENQYAAKMYFDLVKPVCDADFEPPTIEVDEKYILPFDCKKNDFIVIHPGVSKMSIQKGIFKTPTADFWCGLISKLLKNNQKVVLMGTKDDEDIINKIVSDEKISSNPNFINFYYKTKSIKEMADIMAQAKYVICADSAPLHVAIAVNAPTFAIFGPTNDLKLVPDKQNVKVIKNSVACRPCLWHDRSCNCQTSDCLKIDFAEITDLIK